MRPSILLTLAALALATPGGVVQSRAPITANIPAKRKKGLFNDVAFPSWDPLVGTRYSRRTVAQAKREAIKTKNRARNRKAHK